MFGYLRKTIKWTFLLTLPLTNFPILTGTFSGIVFGIWNRRQVDANVQKFVYEIKDVLSDWGVGGDAPTFRQFQDKKNDFHLLRVNSNDWTQKLGLLLPEQVTDFDDDDDTNDLPIDSLADLQSLMRDSSCGMTVPREQWLYWSEYRGWPLLSRWDSAFDEVVQHAYAHPTLNRTRLHFAECAGTAGFLCGVWFTRAPALVQFLVDDEPFDLANMVSGPTYGVKDPTSLRGVLVRIIEFPLRDNDIYTGTGTDTFPSEREQFLTAMTTSEQFAPFEPMDQLLLRFTEYMDHTFWDKPGTIFHFQNQIDNWVIEHITTPFGLEGILLALHSYCFTIAMMFSATGVSIWYSIWNLGEEFLGRPKIGDRVLGELGGEPASPEENFWGPMMEGFGEYVERRMREQRSEGVRDGNALTTEAP
ncbi:Hypothetical predicted protein [Lecanosticta acicola]|uniref:Uncharacterized protein n=1 Tax=Lecanosticta acicola TaxID=111012 RepID=A0AAI9E7X6_9PEZI|nr:Hypothetical predicted protein [Lecanosticta acicola]